MFALVDCNNFYASCERLFRPDLEGRAIIVLSNAVRPGADGVHRWRRISRPPAPRYNLAPSSPLLAVRVHPDGKRVITRLHWGLIPSWAKDRKIGYRTINARAETVAEKPAFRAAFKQRRRLIPADSRICINFIKTHA